MAPSFGESLVHQHTVLAPSLLLRITHQPSKGWFLRCHILGQRSCMLPEQEGIAIGITKHRLPPAGRLRRRRRHGRSDIAAVESVVEISSSPLAPRFGSSEPELVAPGEWGRCSRRRILSWLPGCRIGGVGLVESGYVVASVARSGLP